MNWYKVQAVVVLCVGIYTQFPHKIKRLTPYLFMFINLGEKYFSKLEEKKGIVNLLLCTIVDMTFVNHAYFLLAFIYSCIIDTVHLRWLIIRWRGSYKSSERLPCTKLFGSNQQTQHNTHFVNLLSLTSLKQSFASVKHVKTETVCTRVFAIKRFRNTYIQVLTVD